MAKQLFLLGSLRRILTKMKRIILLATILGLLFILGCEEQLPIETKECVSDSDCIIGGCSGTVCQPKNAEPVFTTCEYSPAYDCYKQISCKCIENKCQWDKTEKFEECISTAGETLNN